MNGWEATQRNKLPHIFPSLRLKLKPAINWTGAVRRWSLDWKLFPYDQTALYNWKLFVEVNICLPTCRSFYFIFNKWSGFHGLSTFHQCEIECFFLHRKLFFVFILFNISISKKKSFQLISSFAIKCWFNYIWFGLRRKLFQWRKKTTWHFMFYWNSGRNLDQQELKFKKFA